MRTRSTSRLALCAACAALAVTLTTADAAAQAAGGVPIIMLEATPKGALPPMPLPMPASRNHNYWGLRLQAGQRTGGRGPDLYSLAGGIDWQLRGGSVFGVTGGFQQRDCDSADEGCGRHALFETRARFGLLTGGPSLGALIGDYSATAVLGLELGIGFAPDIAPDVHACSVDLGAPISLSMLQRIRLVTFFTPALAWNIDCSPAGPPNDASFVAAFGVGVQQLGLRGLDLSLGVQKIVETGAGYQLGLSVSYIRVR